MFEDAIGEIRQAIPKLTPQQQKIGAYFCEHPETLGVLTLSEFAEKIGTSGASINRFCLSLGYSGFVEFSKRMRILRQNKISHASYFHNTIIQNEKSGKKGSQARILLERAARNAFKLAENYPGEKIEECVQLMERSSSIFVIGRMSAYPAALYFEQLLSKTTPKLFPMNGADIIQAAALSRINKESLVFCIAFPRYPRVVLDLAKEAVQNGASIVAITDKPSSPLAPVSKLLLEANVEIFSYIDLYGPVFALIDIICLEFSLLQSRLSEKNLIQFDKIVENAFFIPESRAAKHLN